jgi:PIN domain nuclease of toxin-antitoxin system
MILLDTHIWIWWVEKSPRLTLQQQSYLRKYEKEGLAISIYSFWEIAKLIEYQRLTFKSSLEDWFDNAVAHPKLKVIDLTLPIIIESTRLIEFHKDPADQIIVATAKVLNIPLLTADEKILKYSSIELLR